MKHLVIVSLLLALTAPPAQAGPLMNYLADEGNAAMRVEITGVPGLMPPATFGQRLQSLIRIRQPTRYRPEIGTKFTVVSSAYASSPYQTDSTPCITASGTRVRPGVVASNFLPIGTVLEINEEKYIVEDRMNPRYSGYFIDIWFPSTSQALEFGRKKLEIIVVDYADPGTDVRKEEQAEEADEEVEVVLTRWYSLRGTLLRLTGFLGARVSPDVNRYDVDCFAEEE